MFAHQTVHNSNYLHLLFKKETKKKNWSEIRNKFMNLDCIFSLVPSYLISIVFLVFAPSQLTKNQANDIKAKAESSL
jgi:type III secretory pathway component EscR